MSTVALAIPTTASWAPGRKESLHRLKADLRMSENPDSFMGTFTVHMHHVPHAVSPSGLVSVGGDSDPRVVEYFIHDNRSPREVWWEKIATWGAKTDATHWLQVQDDMRAAPGGLFWRALYAMIEAHPNEIINLQSVHEAAPGLAAERVSGYTTTEGMPGPAYVMPTPMLREFLEWRRTKLHAGSIEKITEDTLIALFCLDTQRRIWAPVPTIVDHPGEVSSTYGNDAGPRQDLYATRQRPRVRWNNWETVLSASAEQKVEVPNADSVLCNAHFWAQPPRHLGRFYPMSIPALARISVKGYSEADEERDTKDTGSWEKQRLVYAAIARRKAPIARLFVCTPFRGGVSYHYMSSLFQLRSALHDIEIVDGNLTSFEPDFAEGGAADLVRTRSHLFRRARENGCDLCLMVDSDVSFSPETVVGMVRTGYDFVQTPYPRRDGRGYSIRWLDSTLAKGGIKPEDVERDTVSIVGTGLGLTLLTRRCIDKLWDHYRNEPDPEEEFEKLIRGGLSRRDMVKAAYELGRSRPRLNYTDFPRFETTPKGVETVALFQLLIEHDEQVGKTLLYGEDISFCKRWIALGEEVRMYIGLGSPASHMGEKLFEGDVFQITGLKRSAPPGDQ